MKLACLLVLLSVLPALAACPKGCEPYQGLCACDEKPKVYSTPPTINHETDEKPRRGQIPAWQSGEVHADMPESQIVADTHMDAERIDAELQGKRAAGIAQ